MHRATNENVELEENKIRATFDWKNLWKSIRISLGIIHRLFYQWKKEIMIFRGFCQFHEFRGIDLAHPLGSRGSSINNATYKIELLLTRGTNWKHWKVLGFLIKSSSLEVAGFTYQPLKQCPVNWNIQKLREKLEKLGLFLISVKATTKFQDAETSSH